MKSGLECRSSQESASKQGEAKDPGVNTGTPHQTLTKLTPALEILLHKAQYEIWAWFERGSELLTI